MKLTQFRVRAFRCIHDTGVVPVSDTATLMGKNESGKTAILAALAHLNKDKPIDPQDICDDLVDELRADDRIIDGMFELTPAERDFLDRELPEVTNLTEVRIFRTKGSSIIDYEFPQAQFPKKFSPDERGRSGFLDSLDALSSKIREATLAKFESETEPKVRAANAKALKGKFDEIFKSIKAAGLDYRRTDTLLNKLRATITEDFESDRSLLGTFGAVRRMFQGAFFLNDRVSRMKQLLREKLHPRLIYFPEYKVIDGIIDVQEYLQRNKSSLSAATLGISFKRRKRSETFSSGGPRSRAA
jgi:hypothetical protein